MYLATGYMGLITGLELFSGWERLPLFGRFGYVEMIRFLTIKVLLLCRLSTDVPGLFVYGPLYNAGESRPVYGGVYTIGGYGEGYFYPTWVAA